MSASPLVRRALAGHAAIGLLACALLYLVCLSGALAVIHDGWSGWEDGDLPFVEALRPEAAQTALIAAADGGRLTIATIEMPRRDWPRAVLTTDRGSWYLNADGRLATPHREGFSDFVVTLHETLTLPSTWGRILVGALGAVLAALVVTGVLAHPRIVRDAFRLRARGGAPIARVDWHNRIGVWTLPFALVVALTGAVFGLAGVATTWMAEAEGSDTAAIYAPVFGAVPAPGTAGPAPLADVAAAMRTLAARMPQVTPSYVILRNPMTRGGDVQILARHPRRLIYGDSYVFDAAGRWQGAAGMAAGAIGQQVAASNYGAHFGDFGGWPVEAAYVALGLGLSVVTATGTAIWLGKRRRRGLPTHRLEAAWRAVTAGVPLALAVAAAATAAGQAPSPAAIFWGVAAMLLLMAVAAPQATAALPPLAAATVAAVAVGHALLAHPSGPWPIAIDLLAAIGGGSVCWLYRTALPFPARSATPDPAFQNRAERLDRSRIQS